MAVQSFASLLLHLPVHSPSPSSHYILFTGYSLFRSTWPSYLLSLQKSNASLYPVSIKLSHKINCLTKSTEESEPETLASDGDDESGDDLKVELDQNSVDTGRSEVLNGSQKIVASSADYPSLGIREPVYELNMGVYLSTPKTEKASEDGEDDRLRFGVSSMQEWRSTMEDANAADASGNGHMVIVIAEGTGQELLSESMQSTDASGNNLLQDVEIWISQKIKEHFSRQKKMGQKKMDINLKYIDPTYMIRAIPSNASDNVYCTLLAQSAVHGAMAGYTGFTVAPVNGRHTYIPFNRIIEKQNKVVITDRMWARLLSSTNQPSFLSAKVVAENCKGGRIINSVVQLSYMSI